MKKLILLLLFIPLVSCKDNKKEMLYDLINKMLIDEIEMSAKDLNLEILALNHNSVITANDSIEYYLKQINKYDQDIIEVKYDQDIIEVDGRKLVYDYEESQSSRSLEPLGEIIGGKIRIFKK